MITANPQNVTFANAEVPSVFGKEACRTVILKRTNNNNNNQKKKQNKTLARD